MEAALRSALKDSLGEFVKRRSLDKSDLSSFPLVLRDLELNEKKLQEEWDEDHESALQLTCGKIGSIKITPGWMGTVDVLATNIELSFSFSPTQALKNGMKPKEQVDDRQCRQTTKQGPPPNCPPRFCPAHNSSDKRTKGDPVSRDCKSCGITLTSSYDGFKLCPPCSEKEQKCMICGSHAPKPTTVEASPQPPPMCPPRFCSAHNSSDKRVKCDPASRDCKKCGVTLQSSYQDFQLCPPCSETEQKCMICGSQAPTSSSYMPGAPQGQAGGHGKQGNLPPPPPPPGCQPWEAAAKQQSRGETSYQTREPISMAPSPFENGQVYHTQLNAPQSQRPSRSPPPPGAPLWDQSRGPLSAQMHNHGPNDDTSLAGFLRFVASDMWKTCSTDTRRLESPERPFIRRGGA